ncbi:MAG TPA: EAL domain-containing protein, partial [Acidobacteriota bacterium]|nr:EAL domain-containing protein [Acidobacteriota bacterium]
IVQPDGSVVTPIELIERIEQHPVKLAAVIRAMLVSIDRHIKPLFDLYPHFYVSVNMPPPVIGKGHVMDMVQELMFGPYLNRIVCELTERQALSEAGRSSLEIVRNMGIRIAIDDFGTGNSGLTQIAGLDLDILKIDRSLILNVLTSRVSARLLRGIVALAESLHVRTVVEGVEKWDHAFFMQAVGVDYGQGWFWSKALPPEQVGAALKNGFPRPATPPRT